MRVASFHVYPVKGCRAVNVDNADVEARGFRHDRRWLVTDEEDRFLTQRECGRLARLIAKPVDGALRLSFDDEVMHVSSSNYGERRTVTIWRDEVNAARCDSEAETWLSAKLNRSVRLYYMDAAAKRLTSRKWGASSEVNFADGYPFLITTVASLDALNEEITKSGGAAVGMERFRPNVVIDGVEPWAEDFWGSIKIGNVIFDFIKPCVRCEVTTKNQLTGEHLGKEPLRSLAKIRRSAHPEANGVLFGWNAIPRGPGIISVDDVTTVVEARSEGFPLACATV